MELKRILAMALLPALLSLVLSACGMYSSTETKEIDLNSALPSYTAVCESYNLQDIEIVVRDDQFLTIHSSNFGQLSEVEMFALHEELMDVATEEGLIPSNFISKGYTYIVTPPEILKTRDLNDIDNLPADGAISDSGPLQIQEGWKWEIDGDYSYIRGRVKNLGTEPVQYFEVIAEYLDEEGNVLDSDYTNSGQQLNPGDMKEFEIMHPHKIEYTKVRVYVSDK